MSKLIDISPLVSERIAVWPGDVRFRRKSSTSIADGGNIDLSAVITTVHVGAHTDAPSHYVAGGDPIAVRPLELYYGPCQVIEVSVRPGSRIRPTDVPDEIRAPRVLFRTGTYPDPEHFNTDFASLSAELVDLVHEKGGVLIGIDTPSVDPYDDKILEAHQALARHDIANLEGVILRHVAPGLYTLIAFPLRLEGADASPVRAVLVADD